MDIKRIISYLLYIVLFGTGFALWQAWQKEHVPTTPQLAVNTVNGSASTLPPSTVLEQAKTTAVNQSNTSASLVSQQQNQASIITVETDVLKVHIDAQGGNLVQLDLPKYPQSADTPQLPVNLLNTNPSSLFVAQSGLVGAEGPDKTEGQAIWQTEKTHYVLEPNQKTLPVTLTWKNEDGVNVTKTYVFNRGQYDIQLNYTIQNQSEQPWTGQFYTQLRRVPPKNNDGLFALHTFTGASISSPSKHYEKLSFKDLAENSLNRSIQGGWLAMQQRYFVTAWVPEQNQVHQYWSSAAPDQSYILGQVSPIIQVAPGKTSSIQAKFYAGPLITENLSTLAPYLDRTIDYGWLEYISLAIFWVMKHIYEWIGNWGWAIVLVTLLIKAAFYQLSATSYRSMAKMRLLTPRIQAIKDRYGEDRQKLSQATMELYKKEKVNPLSGCLPILVQIPFFIALYYVLVESVELRQAPFIFWIKDLSTHDPYYVLPILMGISMFIQQKLNPTPPDPTQAKLMMLLPFVFTIFFLAFPAGLVLYWLVNNCVGVTQQWWINRSFEQNSRSLKTR